MLCRRCLAPPRYQRGASGDTGRGIATAGRASPYVSRTFSEPLWCTAWSSILAQPPQHPIDDVNHVETAIETEAAADEPHRTSAGDLLDDWAAAVDTSNVPWTDVDHLPAVAGFAADDEFAEILE